MSGKRNNALPSRDEIDEKYKWKLEEIYASDSDWEEDFKKVRRMAEKTAGYKGRLAGDMNTLLECLRLSDDMMALNDKLFVYAKMRRDENNANPAYQALTDRATALATEVYASAAFIIPEIISIDEAVLEKGMKEVEGLALYRHYFSELMRRKEHTLSDREEELLALSSEVSQAASDIFTMFNNADIKFSFIKDENGEEMELTKGRYIKFMESRDRRVRQDAFRALYATYSAMENTLAASLNNNIKADKFYASVRKYDSCLSASLDGDNVSATVYDNLIDSVGKSLPALHRYMELRRKALNLDELHMYDIYVPVVEEPPKQVSYEEAKEIVAKGLSPMGHKYIEDLESAFGSGWIDVYENKGKTGGAYSWGTHLTHPYVLLNYQGTIDDVFTLAHEMGHAMHSYYTNRTQPYIYSEYKIFVAEVASTVNESLLMHYLLNNTTGKREKAYLLNHYLEEFRGTLFRQTKFAEFEKITHSMAERGEALTAQEFCRIYKELNEKYFGPGVVIDDEIAMEWARIPHFYTDFYVYKYATGLSAAVSLSQQILKEGAPAVERYMGFLRGGGSDYPLELLKKAGVDLSVPRPVEDALKVFESVLNELEEII